MIAQLKEQALRINQALIKLMDEMGLALVDFKIEFGVDHEGQLLLADEISRIHVVFGIKQHKKTLTKMFIEKIQDL